MMGLTKMQQLCLGCLKAHIEANGIVPSYEQIRVSLGLASKSAVARLITALEERGHIRRIKNTPRSISIVPEGAPARADAPMFDELRRHYAPGSEVMLVVQMMGDRVRLVKHRAW